MAGQAEPWPNLSPTTLLFFPLLLIFSVCPPTSAGAEEGEALLRFKATLSGPGADLPSWIPGPAPCNVNDTTWDGVICFNSHVWGVQLEGKGLAGSLDIGPLIALRALRTISFMHNDLEGPLPDVGRLGALKAVYLSGNRFSGEIPDATFAGMRSLKKLFLSDNRLTGTIPASLAGLGKMLEVRLDHNRFTGRIPEFSQPQLEIVDVSFNSLEGPIPNGLSKMDPALFQGNPNLCGAPLAVICGEKSRPKPGLSGWLLALIIIAAVIFLLALLALLVVLLRSLDDKVAVMGRPSSKKPPETADKLEQGNTTRRHLSSSEARGSGRRGGKDADHGRLAFVQEGRERFELHDLLRASAEVLGSGNFGSSFKAVLSSGPTVVVKRFKEMNGVGKEDFCEHMRRLGRLSHPNLLPLLAYYYRKEEKLLITEFIANGSLAHMLHGNRGSTLPPLDWPTRLKIVKGVARGLSYLYDELPVLFLPHGHLKSSNVLLDDSMEPLLTDYALIPVINAAHASQVMVAYKSPEVGRVGRPSKKSDVWSLGILILEILTGKFPADFLHRGGGGSDLAAWVGSAAHGEAFDGDMGDDGRARGEMRRLLKIGLECCAEDIGCRPEMREVLERVEELRERDD